MTQLHAVARTSEKVPDVSEDRMLVALTAQAPQKIKENFEPTKTARKSATLPLTIRRSLVEKTNPIVMFTSAYGREGAPHLAFHAARAAARQCRGKVLYIHASDRYPKFIRGIENEISISLNDFINAGGTNTLPFVVLEDSGLVCACFRSPGEGVDAQNLKVFMATLRQCFEFIVLGGDNMLASGPSAVFSDLVDGTILVTEAERTRGPVAEKLKKAVEDNGGNVIGAILNRRKYHIPAWIYRFLYGAANENSSET